jgi:ABC-type sugar transport system ATPase subunit
MTAALAIRGLRKSYGSTIALAGLDIDLIPGEILGIAGPNGAGKSTLVRILAGEESADAGSFTFGGAPWSPLESWASVAVVHQEPQLFPNLTVAENILVGREGTSASRPRLRVADRVLMEALGLGHLADIPLGDCTLAAQQRTEIARALARDARIFLFDEPNSALTDEESDELFREMHKISAAGRIVILVTHRLADLVAHCCRVAIIRDGRVRTILEGRALTEDGIAQQLVLGAEHENETPGDRHLTETGDEQFRVTRWTHESAFAALDLRVASGEIVALMGVEGSGARELLRSFAGLERCGGEISIDGLTGGMAIRRRTAYVPATRQFSLYGNFSVGENLVARLGVPTIAGPALALKKRRMREIAADAVRRFLVKTRTLTQSIRSLSGGNQQKVAIAQALACEPRLLLLEEPTRGVDVQSKREIYRLLHSFALAGNAVVMFCTEVLEVFEAADRVLVVSDGRLSPSLFVRDYADVEALATDVSRLERHAHVAA